MPAAIRASGQMWGPDGKLKDTKFVIPDRSYSGVYREVIDFCKKNGAFDVSTMGSVPNVGLMAKKQKSMDLTIKHLSCLKMVSFVLLMILHCLWNTQCKRRYF